MAVLAGSVVFPAAAILSVLHQESVAIWVSAFYGFINERTWICPLLASTIVVLQLVLYRQFRKATLEEIPHRQAPGRSWTKQIIVTPRETKRPSRTD